MAGIRRRVDFYNLTGGGEMKKILLAASALCFFLACNEADTIFKTVEQEKLAPPLD